MGYTRRDFIEGALEEIGLATYIFDMQPEQLQSAMKRLDNMMAEWNAKGIRLAYPIPAGPGTGDLDDQTDVPDSAWQAVVTNLALRIAPSFGRTPMPETKAAAKRAFNTIAGISAKPREVQLRQLPAGAGNKPWRYDTPFLPEPAEPLLAGNDGPLEFN